MQNWLLIAFIAALFVILPLAFYAGRLLSQLNAQNKRQEQVRKVRLDKIEESVQVIALAIEQQQCNLSEGAIRLVNLLESAPVIPAIKCQQHYPALYELFVLVRDLPTHEARDALPKQERRQQDKQREEHEARLESSILKEVANLKSYNF